MVKTKAAIACVVLASQVGSAPAGGSGLPLVTDGTSHYRIVLDPSASAPKRHAARELQTHVRACTGCELPIASSTEAYNGPMFVLGCGDTARQLGVEPTSDDLGEQGCLLRTVPPHILIAGTKGAGTLYGAHRFLETYFGVRWFAPGVTRTPKSRTVRIPPLNALARPAFRSRRTSYAWPGRDADFLARVGMNAGSGDHASPRGLQYDFDGTCHSYFRFVSPGEFFETNPEFVSEIAGTRVRDGSRPEQGMALRRHKGTRTDPSVPRRRGALRLALLVPRRPRSARRGAMGPPRRPGPRQRDSTAPVPRNPRGRRSEPAPMIPAPPRDNHPHGKEK